MRQIDMILRHIEEYGSITQAEAFARYGVARLASRIADIRSMGLAIESEFVRGTNRYGQPTKFASYRFKGANEDAKQSD